MSLKISSQQLHYLTVIERFNFRIAQYLNYSPGIRKILVKLQASMGRKWVEIVTGRIVAAHGFEHFESIDPQKGVLLIANHRSFFDQFTIVARLFRMYGPHHNIYFPIRSNFFYDNPLAMFVTLPFGLASMYPPIVRDARRRRWNQTAMQIMIQLLKDPQNMIGMHPEGTRNQGPDPYEFLSAKPGAGEMAYHARPNVVPVFLQGFPPTIGEIVKSNFHQKNSDPPLVHMVMGEPMDFSAEFQMEPSRKTYLLISRKMMRRIAELGELEKNIRKQFRSSDSPLSVG